MPHFISVSYLDIVLLCFALSLIVACFWRQHYKINQLRVRVTKAQADRTKIATHLTNLSHHLRTPLIGMLGYAEYIQSHTREPMITFT
ncbi:MAG: hypothetical protein EXR35_06945 [Limnohabitans sp.]|nr:hypothetical protein [Limnohabitans sp.]